MFGKLHAITNIPKASTFATILPTVRLLDLLIAFTAPNRGIPYKNSQYCVKISFWFTISQSILFKAIAGHSSLSIAVHTHKHTHIYIFMYIYMWYTYSTYCLLFFLLSCFAIFGFGNEIESNFTLPPNCQKLTSSCQSIKCQLCAVSERESMRSSRVGVCHGGVSDQGRATGNVTGVSRDCCLSLRLSN